MQDLPEIENEIGTGTVDHLTLTASVVAAYVSNNPVRPTDLGELIVSVHRSLEGLGSPTTPATEQVEKPTPAQIKKSITGDSLISFEDGKSYKTLRRHLTTRGLTPESYRAKYGLPADYPMICTTYSAQRSELARAAGLGSKRMGQTEATAKATASDESVSEAPKRRGRAPKAA